VTTPVTPSTTSFAGGSHDDLPPSAN